MRIASLEPQSNYDLSFVNAIPSPESMLVLFQRFFLLLRNRRFPILIAMLLIMGAASNNSLAQGFEDDPFFGNEEFGFGDSDDFQDSEFGSTDGFFEPGLAEDDDPFAPMDEEGDLYIDEDSFDIETEQALQDSLFTQRDLLERERQQSIANIGYGAGTGLMIGGWSAFIAQETTTRNQWRTIGTSTVIGGIIGMLLGTRSIWDPAAPRPDLGILNEKPLIQVKKDSTGVKIAYSLHF